MSLYASIRFRGIIKPEFRKIFEPIALRGEWKESSDPVFRDFGDDPQAVNFSCMSRSIGYVERWLEEPWDRYYSAETGEWSFECDVNLRRDNAEMDFEDDVIPYCMEEVLHYERWYESLVDYDPYAYRTILYRTVNGELKFVGVITEDGQFLPCED